MSGFASLDPGCLPLH